MVLLIPPWIRQHSLTLNKNLVLRHTNNWTEVYHPLEAALLTWLASVVDIVLNRYLFFLYRSARKKNVAVNAGFLEGHRRAFPVPGHLSLLKQQHSRSHPSLPRSPVPDPHTCVRA